MVRCKSVDGEQRGAGGEGGGALEVVEGEGQGAREARYAEGVQREGEGRAGALLGD